MNEIINILIIEDDLPTVALIQNYLKKAFDNTVQILVAGSIYQATQILMNHSVSVILLDLRLPDSNGYESVRRMKNLTQVPIIVLSGVKEEIDKAHTAAFGVDLIPKDDMSQLVQYIINAIEISRRHDIENILITKRLDTILIVIEDLKHAIDDQNPKITKMYNDLYIGNGKNKGIKETIESLDKKIRVTGKITWSVVGFVGGNAIIAAIGWMINRFLG